MLWASVGLLLFVTTDIVERRIPKNLNLLALALLISDLSALTCGILVWSLYLAMFRVSRGGMGYGDVRLAPLTALITSDPGELLALHAGAWIMAGVFLLVIKGRPRTNLPFAPFISLSAGLLQVS